MITIVGDAFVDLICPAHDLVPGETYHRNMVVTCGGTATVAVLVVKLGEEARFLGKVGDDAQGRCFKENLIRNGVNDLTFLDSEHPTGLCLSMVFGNGERTMIASRGANDYLTKLDFERRIGEITSSRIVYFSGYSMLTQNGKEVIPYAMRKCREAGCEIWFNPGAPNLATQSFTGAVRKLVDVLVMNGDEARALGGSDGIEDALDRLKAMADLIVVTLGQDGCVVSQRQERWHVPAEIVAGTPDTTGAGDAFSAGFIAGRLRQMAVVECARLAHHTAASFLKGKVSLL